MKIEDQSGDHAKAGGKISQHQTLVMPEDFAEHRVDREIQKSAAGVGQHQRQRQLRARSAERYAAQTSPAAPPRMVVDSASATSHSIFARETPPPSSSAPSARPSGNLWTQMATRDGKLESVRFLRFPPPAPARPPGNGSPAQSSWPWRIRSADGSWPRQNGWPRTPGRCEKHIW